MTPDTPIGAKGTMLPGWNSISPPTIIKAHTAICVFALHAQQTNEQVSTQHHSHV